MANFGGALFQHKKVTSMQILQMCRKCQDHPYCSIQVQLNPN